MEEIDNKIKTYYEGKSLTKEQLDKIVGSQNRTVKPRKSLLKYAAILLVALISLFLFQNQFFSKKDVLEKYAKEVAFNHHKDLESDILTQNVGYLNDKMDKLNFDIHIPENIDNKYELLGGRYSSIDERLAAQLKLQCRNTRKVATLYVLNKKQSENFDESFLMDATSISIWNDKSNLFVLATDLPQNEEIN